MDNKNVIENESEDFLTSIDSVENHEEFDAFSKAELINFIEKFDWKDNLSKSAIILTGLKAAYDQQYNAQFVTNFHQGSLNGLILSALHALQFVKIHILPNLVVKL